MTDHHEMQGLLLQSYTLEQFLAYLATVKLGDFRPEKVVLHNTLTIAKTWPGHDSKGNMLSARQRILNMTPDWLSRGMTKGPHLLCTMANENIGVHMVHTLTPLTEPGQHSKMWNHVSWGIEMFADFDRDEMPDSFHTFVSQVIRALFSKMGKSASDDRFKMHYEDTISKHFGCPGKNARPKQKWIDAINTLGAHETSVELPHIHHLPFSPGMKSKLKGMEAFRDKAYLLKGVWHIGYGFRDGFKGLKIDANSTMTRAEADALFEKSTDELADTIQMFVTVPLKQYQLDGLGLIAWNIGPGALEGSTIVKRLNAEDTAGAAAAFDLWNKWRPTPGAPLEVSPQLAARRTYERSVFEGRIDLAAPPVLTAVPVQPSPQPLPVVVASKPAPKPGTAPMAPKAVATGGLIPAAAKPVVFGQVVVGESIVPKSKTVTVLRPADLPTTYVIHAKAPDWMVRLVSWLETKANHKAA